MEVVDQVKGVALKAKSDVEKVALQAKLFVVQQWNNRLVQVSVFAGIVFWILSSVPLMDEVEKFLSKTFKFKFGKEGVRLVHAVVFALVMYVTTRFFLDPVVKKLSMVEGLGNGKGKGNANANGKGNGNANANNKCTRPANRLADLSEAELQQCITTTNDDIQEALASQDGMSAQEQDTFTRTTLPDLNARAQTLRDVLRGKRDARRAALQADTVSNQAEANRAQATLP